MPDAEGTLYVQALVNKKVVVNFLYMHGEETLKNWFPDITTGGFFTAAFFLSLDTTTFW